MFTYEIIGYSFIQAKSLFVVHLKYLREGTEGYAVETCFVRQSAVEGGQIACGKLCKIYRDNRGYCQGIEIV
jgi:hypothetical protein